MTEHICFKSLAGKVALITGAGSGIGATTARAFVENGAKVVAIGRTDKTLRAMAASSANPDAVASLVQDVTDTKAPKAAVEFAMERFGRVDFLVNGAGCHGLSRVRDTSDEVMDRFLNVHLRAPFRYARECLQVMQAGSVILNISSILALRGRDAVGIYAVVKAGQIGLTTVLAAEEGPRGIRSNCIAPGVIATDAIAGRPSDVKFQRLMLETIPSNLPMGNTGDIAQAILYLCSPAGRFINGHVLVIDGGWTATHSLSKEALARP